MKLIVNPEAANGAVGKNWPRIRGFLQADHMRLLLHDLVCNGFSPGRKIRRLDDRMYVMDRLWYSAGIRRKYAENVGTDVEVVANNLNLRLARFASGLGCRRQREDQRCQYDEKNANIGSKEFHGQAPSVATDGLNARQRAESQAQSHAHD